MLAICLLYFKSESVTISCIFIFIPKSIFLLCPVSKGHSIFLYEQLLPSVRGKSF